MAVLQVNPNRMELLRLKRQLTTATRGHKLLKDKRDEMMRRFVVLIRENAALRAEVEKKLSGALAEFALCRGVMEPQMLDAALLYPARTVSLAVGGANIMSVDVPRFEATLGEAMLSYGLVQTSALLDGAIAQLADVLPELLRLAEVEKSCNLLADEIERTRRRVNALEFVLIPDLTDTIRSITMKLDEHERGTLSRLMKVKQMMEAQREAQSAGQ